MTYNIKPMVFSDAHYIALGKLLVAFQSLEQSVTHGLLQLMHPNLDDSLRYTHAVINELPFKSRLKLLSHYVETHPIEHFIPKGSMYENIIVEEFKESLEELRAGVKASTQAEEKRNVFVHSHWLTEPAGGPPETVMRFKAVVKHNRYAGTSEFITSGDILNVVNEIEEAQGAILRSTNYFHMLLYRVPDNSIQAGTSELKE